MTFIVEHNVLDDAIILLDRLNNFVRFGFDDARVVLAL
jgi:hypothetical protein